MNYIAKRTLLAFVAGISFFGFGIAQDTDTVSSAAGNLYVVSAKAGGVNLVQGEVTVFRADGTSGALLVGDTLDVGDVVATGSNGRAEVLMNPGSYARLDHNSKFSFDSTSLYNLQVLVSKGSLIFEVYASDDFKVSVSAASSRFYLVNSGVYRVDIVGDQQARLEVWKGKAQAGDANATLVKKGRSAIASDSNVSVSKFRKNMDEFEKWSKARAKSIAKSTALLANRNAGRSVISSFRNNSWNCYQSVGLWMYNSSQRFYSFLPFGYGWRTPYGYRLGSNSDVCLYPDYYRRWPSYNPGPRHNPTGGTTTSSVPQENKDRANRNGTPPFQRMQQTRSVRRTSPSSIDGFPSSNGGTSGTRRSGSSRSTKTTAPAPRRVSPTKTDGNRTTKNDN